MPCDKIDYESEIKKRWQENAKAVPSLVNNGDSDTLQQIKTYASRFDEAEEKVKKKIVTDKMFANCFARDPARQSIHEKLAQEFLARHSALLQNFCKLSQSGGSAIYLTSDGLFQTGEETQNKKIGKALDFYWENGTRKFYAGHKSTKSGGGAQDHQFHEQAELLRKFRGNRNRNQYLFVICDGAYYTDNKIEELRELCSKRSHVCNIEEVCEIVKKNCLINTITK